MYLICGAGGFFIAIPALLGFLGAGIALLLGDFTSLDLFLVTLGGLIGLGAATYAWVHLPIHKLQNRILATIGISIGCVSLAAALTCVWVWPPTFFNGSFSDIAIGSYLYLLPGIVGLVLIFEISLNQSSPQPNHGMQAQTK